MLERTGLGVPVPLAFVSNRDGNWEIYTAATGVGTAEVRRTDNLADDRQPAFNAAGIPRIAFASNRAGTFDIWVMNADGSGTPTLVNTADTAAAAADDREPAFSQDGTRIAFASNRGGSYDIWVMTSDGSGAPRLVMNSADAAAQTADDREPVFSPDGSLIAFASNRDGDWNIYRMNTDGTGLPIRLTGSTADDRHPAFSPSGSRIAFASNRAGDWNVYTMAPTGEAPGQAAVRVTTSTANDIEPIWPEPRVLAFASDRDGNMEIYLWHIDGPAEMRLSTNTATDLIHND